MLTTTPTQNTICDECGHPRAGRHKTRCTIGLAELLNTINERARQLSIIPTRINALGEGGTRAFTSQPPIDLTARAHLDPDSKPEVLGPDDVEHPTLSVDRTLNHWWRTAREVRGEYDNGPWVIHQPFIGDMVRDLRTLARQLCAATGDPQPSPVGHCRAVIGMAGQELVYCREPLYMPDTEPRGDDEPIRDVPAIRCPACDRTYSGVELVRLKLIEDSERQHGPRALRHSSEGSCAAISNDGHRDWRWLTCEAYEAQREDEREAARAVS